jgi:hypothetical protein
LPFHWGCLQTGVSVSAVLRLGVQRQALRRGFLTVYVPVHLLVYSVVLDSSVATVNTLTTWPTSSSWTMKKRSEVL